VAPRGVVRRADEDLVAERPHERILRGRKARRGIHGGHLARQRAISELERRQVLGLSRHGWHAEEEERALVAVGAEEVGDSHVVAGVEERPGLIWQEGAVDDGSEREVGDDASHALCLEDGQERAGGLLPEAGELIGTVAACRRRERDGGGGAFRRRRDARRAATALADRATEELPAARRRHVQADVLRAGRLAEDRHLLRVAAERD